MILHEIIKYKHNLPFSIHFINVRQEPAHCHHEIEILLMLRGFSHYKIYHMDYSLQPGDMIIADVEDLHRIHDSSEDVLMLQLHLDTKKFEEIYPNISSTYFVCEDPGTLHIEDTALKSKQLVLKNHLAGLMMDMVDSPDDFVLHTDNINQIVATLVRYFRGFYMEDYKYQVGRESVSDVDLDRMSRITRYLLSHYDKKVSLEDVSATEHLNPYYVSHLIKNTLGIPFQSFVNGIRLEFAEKNLLFTDQSLTQVAENCGFSSLHYFNKCFQSWYGFSPSQYRKNRPSADRINGLPFTSEEAMDLTSQFLTPVVSIKKLTLLPSMSSALASPTDGEVLSFYQESFRPRIQIRTQEDLLGLGFLRERILAIKPAAFLVNKKLLTPMAYGILQTFGVPIEELDAASESSLGLAIQNTAMAIAHITGQAADVPISSIALFGQRNALFLPEGLATPYYTGYQILSEFIGQDLQISANTISARSENELTLILYNPDPRAILNVRLQTKNLPEQFVLMKKQIPEENNCYTILQNLGYPSYLPLEVVREIDQSHLGLPQFLMADKAVSPVLDFMVYPQHITILVFSTPIDSSLR
jgi:AraC-like DNA-binding protein